MKQQIYTIFDKIASEAGPLFCAKNDAVAIRNFNNLMKADPSVNISDFTLLKVGEFDTCPVIVKGFPENKVLETNINNSEVK